MKRENTISAAVAWLCMAAFCRVAAGQSADAPTEAVHAYTTPEEKRDVAGLVLGPGLTVGGLVEAEAAFGREQGADVSDIVLATLELGVEADLADWARANAVLLWEEDDTEPVDLDVATITLGRSAGIRFYMEAGKLYVPFGVFNSHFVSDPLVLELGETRETAAVFGYAHDAFEIKLGAFNGDLDSEDDDDRLNRLVAAMTLTPAGWVSAGAYWISDLGESDVLQQVLLECAVPYEAAGGAGGFVSLQIERFAVEAEYITALEGFKAGLLSDGTKTPKAWNVELAWALTDALELALRCEGADEFPGMPETQYGACVTHGLTDNVTVALEYLHGDHGSDAGSRDMATARVAVEF